LKNIRIFDHMNKAVRYERIYQQISGLMTKCTDRQARMATICAVLHYKLPYFFWTGFYILQDERLIVSTYQGPVACMELPDGRGVCRAAISSGKTIVVADVHQFEGHVACDSRSASEIVVPFWSNTGTLLGVLDVDSTTPGSFSDTDAEWLEKIVNLIDMA
jgi:L-methionine (R)-S-oxide reductase